MNLIPVSNIDTAALKIYHQLRDKVFSKEGSFIADSPKVVNILLETDIEVKSILATQEYYDTFSLLLASKEELVCYVANKEMMQDLSNVATVKNIKNASNTRFCIVDNKEILLFLTDDKKVHKSYDSAVWIEAPHFVGYFNGLFENEFKQ